MQLWCKAPEMWGRLRNFIPLHPTDMVTRSFRVLFFSQLQANCLFNAKRYRNDDVITWTNSKTLFVIVQLVRSAPPPPPLARREAKTNCKGEISLFSVQHKFSQIPTKWHCKLKETFSAARWNEVCRSDKKGGIQRFILTLVPCNEKHDTTPPGYCSLACMWALSVVICCAYVGWTKWDASSLWVWNDCDKKKKKKKSSINSTVSKKNKLKSNLWPECNARQMYIVCWGCRRRCVANVSEWSEVQEEEICREEGQRWGGTRYRENWKSVEKGTTFVFLSFLETTIFTKRLLL